MKKNMVLMMILALIMMISTIVPTLAEPVPVTMNLMLTSNQDNYTVYLDNEQINNSQGAYFSNVSGPTSGCMISRMYENNSVHNFTFKKDGFEDIIKNYTVKPYTNLVNLTLTFVPIEVITEINDTNNDTNNDSNNNSEIINDSNNDTNLEDNNTINNSNDDVNQTNNNDTINNTNNTNLGNRTIILVNLDDNDDIRTQLETLINDNLGIVIVGGMAFIIVGVATIGDKRKKKPTFDNSNGFKSNNNNYGKKW
ncbi:hypothetical protein J2127_000550 [Methanococcus voltae]|uniref:hypothetical protein n=1 Tax=Methanococcus voltae TaxID=2188 RepID=UPI001AE52CF7|nr:hypothetical protein [Methanococcus voltae]MBP2143395.1 hypothetical protein [Methanococcus voltae]